MMTSSFWESVNREQEFLEMLLAQFLQQRLLQKSTFHLVLKNAKNLNRFFKFILFTVASFSTVFSEWTVNIDYFYISRFSLVEILCGEILQHIPPSWMLHELHIWPRYVSSTIISFERKELSLQGV